MIVDHRDVSAAFRRLAVPIAVQFAGDQILGVVDTIVIGSFGATALAGVTASSAIFFALSAMVISLLSGGTILAAQRIGARDIDGFATAVRSATVGPFILALFITAGAILSGSTIVRVLVGPIASAHASGVYLALRCVSMLVFVFTATLIGGLGAAGNRRLGIQVLAVINLVHIPLLLVLALGFITHHPMSIVGAGISSLASETVGLLYAIFYVCRHPEFRIFASLRTPLRTAWECTRLGAPEAIFIGAILIPDAMLVKFIAPLGVMAVAGLRALNIASDLTFIVPSPLQSATQTVLGQRLGARDFEGARTFFYRARKHAVLLATIAGAVVALFAWPLAYLLTLNVAVATLAAGPLALHMLTLPLKGWAMLSIAPIRAAGDTKFSMFAGLACAMAVLPLGWLAVNVFHAGLYAVPIAWIAAWLARLLVTEWKIRRGDWLRPIPE